MSELEHLWQEVITLNHTHFPHNNLAPIVGNGQTNSPKVMFIFINPTAKNIGSDPSRPGPRFPFIGTKQVWRIFHKADLISDDFITYINPEKTWSQEFTLQLLAHLKYKGIYITNIVKWTGHDATIPDSKKINIFLPLLKKEIEIVKPQQIVTFGLIPFEHLTNQKIKLKEYFQQVQTTNQLPSYDLTINATATKVIPCYFPVGRGNPIRAVHILKLLKV